MLLTRDSILSEANVPASVECLAVRPAGLSDSAGMSKDPD